MLIQDPLTDPRRPYTDEVPILKVFEDIVKYFAPITIDEKHGWAAAPPGQACWKLVGFQVTVGINEIMPIVLKQDNSYLPDKEVNWYYPGIPDHISHPLQPPYFVKGLSARTKGQPDNNGAHFTISGDHNVGPGHAGPDSVWVAVEPGWPEYSDAVHGLGMRVNTNHLVVSPIFQYVVKTEEGTSGPGEPGGSGTSDETGGTQPGGTTGPDDTTEEGKTYLAIVVNGQEIGHVPFKPKGSA